jgi:PhnB protein
MANAANAVPQGYQPLMIQLTLDDAAASIEWYKRAFGAEEQGRSLGPDGKIMHGELLINGHRVFVNDTMSGQKGPKALGGSPAGFWLYVQNSDEAFQRATDAGAKTTMPLADQFWGDRAGAVSDPEGYVWWIATRKEDLSREEIERRATEFFKQMAGMKP